MKISVIVPVYNAENYLAACLDSILSQTYQNFEVILINDGSKDSSGRICDEYAKIDARIRVVHQENHGVSHARNVGLSMICGDLVSFIDSDDTLEPDMYALLARLLQEHGADISHCGYKRFDKQGQLVREVNGTHRIIIQNGEEAIVCMLRGECFSNALWNKLFRKQIVRDLRFQENLKNNEDVLFNVHAFSRARTTVFQDEGKYHYYDRPTSTCNNLKTRKQNQDAIVASEQMLPLVSMPEAVATVHQRIYEARVNHLRWLVRNRDSALPGEIKAEKALLEQAWQRLSSHTPRQQINYLLLSKAPFLYRLIYWIYDVWRTPNWDAKG